MQKVNDIRKKYQEQKSIQYDYILQTRPDILFKETFNIDKIISRSKKLAVAIDEFSNFDYVKNLPLLTVCSLDFPWVINIKSETIKTLLF